MFQAILWDFDGMLFDSYPHMIRAMQIALQADGKNLSYQDILPYIKISVSTAMEHFSLSEAAQKVYVQREADAAMAPLIRPYPGMENLLRDVSRRTGAKHFLYTHRDRSALEYLREAGMEDCFYGAVTHEDGFPSKPAPDAIQFLIERYGLDKNTAIMLGDREIDVLSGRNAGIHSCLFDEFQLHPQTAADFTVTSISQLHEFLLRDKLL